MLCSVGDRTRPLITFVSPVCSSITVYKKAISNHFKNNWSTLPLFADGLAYVERRPWLQHKQGKLVSIRHLFGSFTNTVNRHSVPPTGEKCLSKCDVILVRKKNEMCVVLPFSLVSHLEFMMLTDCFLFDS